MNNAVKLGEQNALPPIQVSSPSSSSPRIAKSHSAHKLLQLTSLPSSPAPNQFIHNDILYINVGGRVFTTTKNTMTKSGLFQKILSLKQKPKQSNAPSKSESVKRQTTFENYCVEHLEKNNNPSITDINDIDGIYEINSNYYFVDRAPSKFDDILHFLRNYPTINGQQFIERYYTPLTSNPQNKMMRKNSFSSSLSISSCSSSTTDVSVNLLRLQDEARFYEIDALIQTIQEKLDECKYNFSRSADDDSFDKYQWWDQSGPLKGLRRIPGTRIAFATTMDNWVQTDATFEVPSGYKWATQSEYLEEYYSKRDLLSGLHEWIHFGIGDWDNYRWKYVRKVAFIFKDTFKSQRFVHSGMEVCDINHVKSLLGFLSESPLMEYDDNKGIIEGFAGLILLSDKVWSEAPPSDDWTSDEDDEQIQSLKRTQLLSKKHKHNKNKNKNKTMSNNHYSANKTAPDNIYPNVGPPQLANTFADHTKKQKATLTKNNLIKHQTLIQTLMEHEMHSFVPIHQSPQYIHQLPHYNYCGQLPPIPAPQLRPRLSVNSLPVPSTNHTLMHHTQKQ